MSALLQKLGVPRNVRLFFEPYYQLLPDGSLQFANGEHFGSAFHRVPLSGTVVAGEGSILCYSFSLMEAIAFLALNQYRFADLRTLRFVALGSSLTTIPTFAYRKCQLLFGNDPLSRLADIRLTTTLIKRPLAVSYDRRCFRFVISKQRFSLHPELLSLHAFEQLAGIRSGIRTYKPAKAYSTFLQQLLHESTSQLFPR